MRERKETEDVEVEGQLLEKKGDEGEERTENGSGLGNDPSMLDACANVLKGDPLCGGIRRPWPGLLLHRS